ncbi:MAG: glycosyltransferase [Rudaea sp.]
MTEINEDLKAIILARDGAIASLREQNKELVGELLAKEANIQLLKSATEAARMESERIASEYGAIQTALTKAAADISEKESVIAQLGCAPEEIRAEHAHASEQQNAQASEPRRAYEEVREEFVRVSERQGSLLQEKEATMARLGETHAGVLGSHTLLLEAIREQVAALESHVAATDPKSVQLERELSQLRLDRQSLLQDLALKEACIRELAEAVNAYRMAHPSMHYLTKPLRAAVNLRRGAEGLVRSMIRPRLGNLNQHAPTELALPAPFASRRPVEKLPRISIVTPSYMQAVFIERTIDSVLDQRYPNLEYFVQDGGSTDGTQEILERRSAELNGWESRRDGGQSQAINLAFAHTRGDIMAWLNSDDLLLPGSLDYVADYFMHHPDVDVVYGHRLLIDERDKQIGRWIMPAHSDEVLSWADFVPQETLFWRRGIWDRSGARIDESFRFAMDWDLLLRMRDAGARFACLPRALGAFRIHTQQKTSAEISDVGFKEMALLRERALGMQPSSVQINAAIAPYLARHMLSDIAWRFRGGR